MSIVQINLLTVPEGRGEELERRFANRKRAVDGMPGFEGFDLLRPASGDNQRYMVLTRWESQEAFEAWLSSRDFQQGHAQADGGGASAEAKRNHAEERRHEAEGRGADGGRQPAATDSELWGFEVVDLDATLADG